MPEESQNPEYQIAVISDDKYSSHDLDIQLRFVGESTLMLTSKNWLATLKKPEHDSVYAVLINGISDKDESGIIEVVHQLKERMPILLLENNGDVEVPAESKPFVIRLNEKQLNYQSLQSALRRSREMSGLKINEPKSSLISETGTAMFRSLVGDSASMQQVRTLIQQVANKNVPVLVTGESGTGKEIVARNIHYHSGRGDKPFVAVNCAAIDEEQFGLEFYGCEPGYNNATAARSGFFEKAEGGTLFLDEIGDMSIILQARILRFLEEKSYEKLGGTEPVYSDIRIVAATHQDLEDKINKGGFREDLYYRLNVIPIELPALRSHTEDIPDLVQELIARLENKSDVSVRLNSTALASLQKHKWPGNVRELANLIERMSIIHSEEVIGVSDLPVQYQHLETHEIAALEDEGGDSDKEQAGVESESVEEESEMSSPVINSMMPLDEATFRKYLQNFEKHLIKVALDDCEGLQNFAAERLSMTEKELKDKIQKYNLKI